MRRTEKAFCVPSFRSAASLLSDGGSLSLTFGKMLAEMLFDSMAKPWLTALIDEQIGRDQL